MVIVNVYAHSKGSDQPEWILLHLQEKKKKKKRPFFDSTDSDFI